MEREVDVERGTKSTFQPAKMGKKMSIISKIIQSGSKRQKIAQLFPLTNSLLLHIASKPLIPSKEKAMNEREHQINMWIEDFVILYEVKEKEKRGNKASQEERAD